MQYEGSGTSDRRTLVQDERDSVVAINGATNSVNSYDDYGTPAATNTGRFQYTGQMWLGEAGVYHYKARAYVPQLGRFAQTDPIGFAGGMNIYAYVQNDPINWVDPLGLEETADEIVVTVRRVRRASGGAGFSFMVIPTVIDGGRLGLSIGGYDPESGENEIVVTAQSRAQQQAWFTAYSNRRSRALGAEFCAAYCTLYAGGAVEYLALKAGAGILAQIAAHCGCFVEGTLVATPEGLRRIEDIEVGDEVLAWDPETGETSTQTVTALIRPEPKLIWRLETRDGDGETEVFEVTNDHPWYVEGQGWVETQNLHAGQRIETADDRGLTVLDVARTDRVERTYNLTVDGPHTFLVGEDGAVVHNCKWFNPNYLPPGVRQQVFAALERVRGGVGGAPFRNWRGTLPTGVQYTRYTVGSQSGPIRIVTGGGNTYISFDHYGTFFRLPG